MKKIFHAICLLATIFLFSCESPDFDLEWHEERLGIKVSDLEGKVPDWCMDGYKGPSGDIQVDAFCIQAFGLICAGYAENSSEVIQVCNTFKAFSPSYSCPYCP